MSTQFDPYYKWLGIPPKDQPPHLYRLLGIELFEPDSEVIDAAANRLMAYLHDLASGPQVEASQKLLGEIAQARMRLLDPKRKAAYDAGLREQLENSESASPQAEAAGKNGGQVRSSASGNGRKSASGSRSEKPLARARSLAPAADSRPFARSDSDDDMYRLKDEEELATEPESDEAEKPLQAVPVAESARSQTAYRPPRNRRQQIQQNVGLTVGLACALVALVAVAAWVIFGGSDDPGGSAKVADAGSSAADEYAERPSVDNGAMRRHIAGLNRRGTSADAAGERPPAERTPPASVTPDPAPALSEAELRELLEEAEEAIENKEIRLAVEKLETYVSQPSAPEVQRATDLLLQANSAISEDLVMRILTSLSDQELRLVASGQSVIRHPQIQHPVLAEVFQQTLRRHIPKAARERGGNPPAVATVPDTDEPTSDVGPPDPGDTRPDPQPEPEPEPEPEPPSADPEKDPAKYLAQKGLVAGENGFWVLADEKKLAELVEPLSDLERKSETAYRKVRPTLEQTAALRTQFYKAEQRLEELLSAGQLNLEVTRFVSQHQPQVRRIEAALREAMPQVFEAYGAQMEALVRAVKLAEQIDSTYAALEADPGVATALENAADAKQRLGPSRDYSRERRDLEKYEKRMLTNWAPITWEGDYARVCAVINEQAAAPFEFRPDAQQCLVPDSVIARAGIKINPSNEQLELILRGGPMGAERRVRVQRFVLPSVRIGEQVVENIQALALPPGAEDLGFVLNQGAFGAYQHQVDRGLYRFVLEPIGAGQ